MPFEITTTNEEKQTVNVNAVTTQGRPAVIDGALEFEKISGDGTVEYDFNVAPLAPKFVSGDALADTVWKVSGDKIVGEGRELIEDTVTHHVTSATAASFGFSAGAIEPK